MAIPSAGAHNRIAPIGGTKYVIYRSSIATDAMTGSTHCPRPTELSRDGTAPGAITDRFHGTAGSRDLGVLRQELHDSFEILGLVLSMRIHTSHDVAVAGGDCQIECGRDHHRRVVDHPKPRPSTCNFLEPFSRAIDGGTVGNHNFARTEVLQFETLEQYRKALAFIANGNNDTD